MKELIEFAQFSTWIPSNGDQFRLYELAIAGVNREDARSVLEMNTNHFNVVYKKLKDNLTNGVSVNNNQRTSEFIKKKAEIRNQCNSAFLMLNADKKHAGIPLARAAMRKAEKYGMYEIALALTRELRNYYAIISIKKNYYEFYTKKQKALKNIIIRELEAEDILFDFIYSIKKGKPNLELEATINELDKTNIKSWRFHYTCFIFRLLSFQIKGKEADMLSVCSEALNFFHDYKNLPYVVKYSFYSRFIAANIARKEFRQAEIMINRCLEDPAVGKLNWQIIMFFRAIAGFHSGKPAIAYNAFNKISNISKKHQTKEMKERFMVVNAYLALLGYDLPKKFFIGRFLNSFNLLNNDKKAMNVTLIILELMHLLKVRKFSRFTDRCEQLDRYIHDHLKGKGRDRCISFLRLMQCIVRGGFRLPAIERKAEPYLTQLKNSRPNISSETIEIVPFETLWDMAKGMVKK